MGFGEVDNTQPLCGHAQGGLDKVPTDERNENHCHHDLLSCIYSTNIDDVNIQFVHHIGTRYLFVYWHSTYTQPTGCFSVYIRPNGARWLVDRFWGPEQSF